MTLQNVKERTISFRENMACKILGIMLKLDSDPESYRVPVCLRNKIVVRLANLFVPDVDAFVLDLLMANNPKEKWDDIEEFCVSLWQNMR